ncbi:hypothetical protein C1N71_02655 [Agrococcus sp. SGAir0287]|nr:hypothetical protein C1N71_02655 [Agrococcus sp. SGAir0287]
MTAAPCGRGLLDQLVGKVFSLSRGVFHQLVEERASAASTRHETRAIASTPTCADRRTSEVAPTVAA